MAEIYSIIKETFDKEYFLDIGSKETEEKIKNQIYEFKSNFPEAIDNLYVNITNTFPNAIVENWTQFFNLDRCIRFLVKFNNDSTYICQLSIYGYFCIYTSPLYFLEGEYIYGEKKFINYGEDKKSDLLFKCANVLSEEPIWLDSTILDETIFDLSMKKFNYVNEIKIKDLLFTPHYL